MNGAMSCKAKQPFNDQSWLGVRRCFQAGEENVWCKCEARQEGESARAVPDAPGSPIRSRAEPINNTILTI